MKKKSEYYQLVASLPNLQGKLNSEFEHMSRITFNKHLKELSEDDYKMVKDLENFIIWEKHDMDNDTDEEFKAKALYLKSQYQNETFLKTLDLFIKIRLFLGLLRKRRSGLNKAPNIDEIWALKEHEYNFKYSWDKKDFGIKGLSFDLAEINDLIINKEPVSLEKLMLEKAWDIVDKLSHGHYFDIDFILIYAIRRNIIEEWNIINNPVDVMSKFNTLAAEAIMGIEKEE